MPKMKTKKALKSRFKVTGSGKLRRNKPGKRHNLMSKTSGKKRQIGRRAYVESGEKATYIRLLGAC